MIISTGDTGNGSQGSAQPHTAKGINELSYRLNYVRSAAAMLGKLDRLISDNPVQVIVGGETISSTAPSGVDWSSQSASFSMGDNIFFNVPKFRSDPTTMEGTVILTGMNYHELAHVMFTPRDIQQMMGGRQFYEGLQMRYGTDFAFSVMNIMEDSRIERLFLGKLPSTRRYFEVMVAQEVIASDETTLDVLSKFSYDFRTSPFINDARRRENHRRVRGQSAHQTAQSKTLYPLVAGRRYLNHQMIDEFRKRAVAEYGDRTVDYIDAIMRRYLDVVFNARGVEVTRHDAHLLIEQMCKLLFDNMSGEQQAAFANFKAGHTQCGQGTQGSQEQAQVRVQQRSQEQQPQNGDGQGEPDNQKGSDQEKRDNGGQDGRGQDQKQSKAADSSDDGKGDSGHFGDQNGDADGDQDDGDGGGSQAGGESAQDSIRGSGQGIGTTADGRYYYKNLTDMVAEVARAAMGDTEFRKEVGRNRQKIIAGSFDPKSLEHIKGKGSYGIDPEWRMVQRKLEKTFDKLRADAEPGWNTHNPAGRVNLKRFGHDLNQGEGVNFDTLFDTWDEDKSDATDIECFLAIDVSASMSWATLNLSKSLWAIRRSLHKIGASCTITLFGNGSWVFDPEHKVPQPGRFEMVPSSGSTVPLNAVRYSYAGLKASKRTHKLFIALTDGMWSNNAECDEMIESMSLDGVVTAMAFMSQNRGVKSIQDVCRIYGYPGEGFLTHKCSLVHLIHTPIDFVNMTKEIVASVMRRNK